MDSDAEQELITLVREQGKIIFDLRRELSLLQFVVGAMAKDPAMDSKRLQAIYDGMMLVFDDPKPQNIPGFGPSPLPPYLHRVK